MSVQQRNKSSGTTTTTITADGITPPSTEQKTSLFFSSFC
jgi:hypothetical protein